MSLSGYEYLFLNHGFVRSEVLEYEVENYDIIDIQLKYKDSEECICLYFSCNPFDQSTVRLLITFDNYFGSIEVSENREIKYSKSKYIGYKSCSLFELIDHISDSEGYPEAINVIMKNMHMFS